MARRPAAGVTLVARPTQRVLLMRRSPFVYRPGLWSVPAGRIEPNEHPLDSAMRELNEETGFRGQVEVLGQIEQPRFTNYICVVPDEFKPRLNWENDMAGWFAKGYHPQPLHPGMERVLATL